MSDKKKKRKKTSEEYISLKEAGRRLSYSSQYLCSLIKRKKLKGKKIKGKWFIKEGWLEDFLKEKKKNKRTSSKKAVTKRTTNKKRKKKDKKEKVEKKNLPPEDLPIGQFSEPIQELLSQQPLSPKKDLSIVFPFFLSLVLVSLVCFIMNPLFLSVAKDIPHSFVFIIKKADSFASFFLKEEIILSGKNLLADIQDIIEYDLQVFKDYCAWLFSQF